MVLFETIPGRDDEIAANLAGGDDAIYRACAAHITGRASYLSRRDVASAEVIVALRDGMARLREGRVAALPALEPTLRRAIMRHLVDDVELGAGNGFEVSHFRSRPRTELYRVCNLFFGALPLYLTSHGGPYACRVLARCRPGWRRISRTSLRPRYPKPQRGGGG